MLICTYYDTGETDALFFLLDSFRAFLNRNNHIPDNRKELYRNFVSIAKKLAKILKGKAYELSELIKYKKGFDVLIVCTSSSETIITKSIYNNLVASELSKKVIINLGIPNNVESEVANQKSLNYIDINSIKTRAEKNLQLLKKRYPTAFLIKPNK